MGIVTGIIVFLLLCVFIFADHVFEDSNAIVFDKNLVKSMENGDPIDILLKEIDEETVNMRNEKITYFNRDILNPKLWGNGEFVSEEELNYYANNYDNYMNLITEYDRVRKQYVKGEISKEEFLEKSYYYDHILSP